MSWKITGAVIAAALALGGCTFNNKFAHPDQCREEKDVANQERLFVQNNGKWCSFIWTQLYGAGNDPIRGGKMISAPAHGTLRVTDRPEKTWYDYKPEPGYVGQDEFVIQPNSPGARTHTIEVVVTAPPPG